MELKTYQKLGLKTVDENEIKVIKKYKLIYSIIKYMKQNEGFQKDNNVRYMKALQLNEEDINENMFEDAEEILKQEYAKVSEIREENQSKVNELVEKMVMNLAPMFEKADNDEMACARIFQYVTESIEYNDDLYNYDILIPFASDYPMGCYDGIPMGNNFEDILLTKKGTSLEIASLMTFLGKAFDVNISTIVAEKDGKSYYINSFEEDGKVSYIDATSAIKGDDPNGCFLITMNKLQENGINLDTEFEEIEVGNDIRIDMRHGSRAAKAISREKSMLMELAQNTEDNQDMTRKIK